MTDALVASVGSLMADKDPPPTVTGRIATELMEMARIICAHTKGSGGKQLKLTDYLDSVLRPRITKDYEEVLERIRSDHPPKGRRKSSDA